MKVDPNLAVGVIQECVLCDDGRIVMYDGSVATREDLNDPDGAFLRFCGTLDPNRCYIRAVIPNDADRPLFFEAREVARSAGLHMQSSLETPERHRAMWNAYVQSKQAPAAGPADDPGDG